MKVTRERKIIGAVLLIALGVLGSDQLSGGGAAAADEAAQAHSINGQSLLATTAKASNKSSAHHANTTDGISLATRLATLAERSSSHSVNGMRDVFRPAEGWFTKPKPSTSTASAEPQSRSISPAEQFVSSHKLSAISFNAAGGGVAVVDGTLVHVGGWIDGYRLRALTHNSALFESSDGAVAQLKLPIAASPVTPMSSAAAR